MAFTLKGIISARATPLTKDGKINEKALRKFTDYLMEDCSASTGCTRPSSGGGRVQREATINGSKVMARIAGIVITFHFFRPQKATI
jgi:hypothetical protein